MDPFPDWCFMSVMLSCLLLAALWSTAWKGSSYWGFLCDVFLCFFHFPIWCTGSIAGEALS